MSSRRPNDDELIGQTIAGRYRIISRLGAGGMGVAYRAWDEEDGVPVVIKIPKKAFLDDPKFAERFAREIRLLQGLEHPHIVPIVDVGEHEGLPYVAMRFLPGGSLSNRRLRDADGKTRSNPPGMLHLWLPAVADALDHVHANGVVHRDVKPANIFFDAYWNAFLGDFGIAKIVEESDSFDREHTLTATNMGIGTQEYMGPEQFTPKPLPDGRTDQYALAVTVYEMLAGTRPFTGTTAHLIVEVTTQPVPRLDRAVRGLPSSLVEAVHRGLAKNPQERFPTCREFAYHVLRDVPLLADEPDIARLLCPRCSNILKLPLKAAGQRGKCPKCQTQMKVADDLGALWLLDEARRQSRSAVSVVDVSDLAVEPDASDAGETGIGIDEQALEAFKPVSSTTPIEREARKQAKKPSLGMIIGGVAATAVALAGLWMVFGGGGGKKRPVTYEQKLAQAEEKVRQDPDDTAANDFLARHWCFKQDDWKKGLPYLAKSGAIGLRNTAQKQLELEAANPATGAGDLVKLAQSWWTLVAQTKLVAADEATSIKKHAVGIYMAAVDRLTDSKDIEGTNQWLEGNKDFLATVGGKRPPKVKPKFPEGAIAFKGHTYFFPRNQTNQIEARLAAEKLGGGLVVIDNADENAFIAKNARGPTWIGIGKSGNSWVQLAGGAKATYFSWEKGQPSNGPGEVAASTNPAGLWHDHFGTDQLFYAVEWPEASTNAAKGTPSPTSPVSDATDKAAKEILSRPPLVNSIGMKLKLIPPGTFMMGSEDGEPIEKPVHEVRITKPYYIGVYEVTNAQWKAVMRGIRSRWKEDDRPAEHVSWVDALDFCKKLSENPAERSAGRLYRLPTEAEWEYACRAGSKTRYSFGDDQALLEGYGWFEGNAGGQTHAVGKKKPNPWGLHDMHGNVHEWCSDWLREYPSTTVVDPHVEIFSNRRVYRGGNWMNDARSARSTYRYGFSTEHRHDYLGFRVALSEPTGIQTDSPAELVAATPELAAAYAKLKQDPTDRAANGVIGRHLCFTEKKWAEGVPFLAKGDIADFARAATAELLAGGKSLGDEPAGTIPAPPANPGSSVQAAKRWWTLAARKELNTADSAAVIRSHAAELYAANVSLLKAPLDVQYANEWLDADREFRELVGNRRPAQWPKTTFAFNKADLESQFTFHDNAVINEKNEIECRGGWSKAVTRTKFKIPLRVEFDAYSFADRNFDMDPGILTDEDGGGGIELHYGTNHNTQTHLYVFGALTTGLPHAGIEPGRLYRIAFDIDEFRNLTITIDGKLVHASTLPEGTRSEGHVSCCGGAGHSAYKGLSVQWDGADKASNQPAAADPGTLSQHRASIGQTLSFNIVGSTTSGSVWGSNPYTTDSRLSRAAVHAGLLKPGEAGVVRVTILPGLQSYAGSTRNGVTTSSYGAWGSSYRIEAKGSPASQPLPDPIIGKWKWYVKGGEVPGHEFLPKGLVKDTPDASWLLVDPTERRYQFRWGNGAFLDAITLSPDGSRLEGKNNEGAAITGIRVK